MPEKKCPNCGRETHPGASFCLGCGQTFDVVDERETARPYRPPQRSVEPELVDPEYVPPPRPEGERLSYAERERHARQRSSRVAARERQRPVRPWWVPRLRRIPLLYVLTILPTLTFLAIMALVFAFYIADSLAQDDGTDRASFAATGDFEVGRVVTVGMTRNEIDGTAFSGVVGWRAVYLNEASGGSWSLPAGDVSLTPEGSHPLKSPYYAYVAFPAAGTGATPVMVFFQKDTEQVFHVSSVGCEVATRALEATGRPTLPPGSTCGP